MTERLNHRPDGNYEYLRDGVCIATFARIEDALMFQYAEDTFLLLHHALNYIEHSEANKGKLTTDAEWDANVEQFRKQVSLVSVGRSYTDKASINLACVRAIIAKVKEVKGIPT